MDEKCMNCGKPESAHILQRVLSGVTINMIRVVQCEG